MTELRTRDISLAAYIRFRGYELISYQLVDGNRRRGEGEWIFDISQEEFNRLKVEYVNSDIAIYEGIRRGMTKQRYN